MLLKNKHFIYLVCTIATLGLAACDTGSVEAPVDNGDGAFGEVCVSNLSITGTFAPDGTGLDEEGSCVPIGTWTVNVALNPEGSTCSQVNVESQYVYTVADIDDEYIVTYTDDPQAELTYTKVTIEGPCLGDFEHYSPDGLELTILKPFTNDDFTLGGSGTFEVYNRSQL